MGLDFCKEPEEALKKHCEKFEIFGNLLSEYNKKYNLTSICGEKEVFYKHFFDSIAAKDLFDYGAKVVEIGSGGGFPSVPLKIVREDLKFTLIESTGKKCEFLKTVVDKLGFNCVNVLNIRAEDGGRSPELRERFDFAVARAVAKLNTLCEYCLPYVKVGGRLIAYKGEGENFNESLSAVKILGGEIENVLNYSLPENYGARNLVIIKKTCATPLKYPRGNGKERKNPL
ncbi:MAG: 16S rRNA (guanine(527)-N(7))-methyltransferase RsmG [Clostridia bacterium]|nr:16S rRNA (guanine(527)-N(7))-methyltransferase RsmG [Clostridia bacterium]